ncbi:MAG TPA: HAD family hydrolase [Clostridia bacterium]|nr:HAD family hydrolase [Clostridia bacterium]
MSIITVDFDGTLYQHNSIIATLKGGKELFAFRQWVYILGDIIKGLVKDVIGGGSSFRILFLESFFRQMKGKSMEELHGFFESLVTAGHQGINFDLVSRLAKHFEDGDRIIVLSGGLQPFLEVFIQKLGLQANAIGTLLFYDDEGICTGEIGKINSGAEKVNRLNLWINENDAGGETVWAYADSESDIPLLEFADKAIVVNPSKALKDIALSKGWEFCEPV